MRVNFSLSPNYKRLVPFNYQQQLTGRIHRWLGPNAAHDSISLYSVSWLGPGDVRSGALNFPRGTMFHVSAAQDDLLADIMEGLQVERDVNWGMQVTGILPQRTPEFGTVARFRMQSPVLIKRKTQDGQTQFYYYDNPESDALMTETLHTKMKVAGIEGEIQLRFDREARGSRLKMTTYRGINNKASYCPVIAEGDPHCIAFAWNVGIGNSTGIGFGAIK
ncbi:MAG: CRISPR-associated endoribonuclease Cas6 [Bacteroidota bacterium]